MKVISVGFINSLLHIDMFKALCPPVLSCPSLVQQTFHSDYSHSVTRNPKPAHWRGGGEKTERRRRELKIANTGMFKIYNFYAKYLCCVYQACGLKEAVKE